MSDAEEVVDWGTSGGLAVGMASGVVLAVATTPYLHS